MTRRTLAWTPVEASEFLEEHRYVDLDGDVHGAVLRVRGREKWSCFVNDGTGTQHLCEADILLFAKQTVEDAVRGIGEAQQLVEALRCQCGAICHLCGRRRD